MDALTPQQRSVVELWVPFGRHHMQQNVFLYGFDEEERHDKLASLAEQFLVCMESIGVPVPSEIDRQWLLRQYTVIE